MTLVIPNVGEQALLDNALKQTTPEALTLKLYSNNYDPLATSVVTDFTEVAISGYAAAPLARAGWGASVGGAPSLSTFGVEQVFNFAGSGNVVGYYVVGATSGTLYWAERMFAGTGQAFSSGDALRVTPVLSLGSALND